MKSPNITASPQLVGNIRALIKQSRQQVASTVNSALTNLYWHIGQRIHRDLLLGERAAYGKHIVSAVQRQLSWTHLKTLIHLENPLKRDFYLQMCQTRARSRRSATAGYYTMQRQKAGAD